MSETKTAKYRHWSLNKHKGIDGPLSQTIIWIIMIITILLVALPVIMTFLNSLKTNYELNIGVWSWPMTPRWSNWAAGLQGITSNMLNSVIVGVASTVVGIFFASLTSYVFVRHQFPAKNLLFLMVVAMMIIPGVLTLTPSFLQMIEMGLKETWWALFLPNIAGMQVGCVFIFRTFMSQQPRDLYEAAMIDGANDFTIYARICIPLAIPIIAIQAVGSFGAFYNDYLWPLLVISRADSQMLMPILRAKTTQIAGVYDEAGIRHSMYLLSGIPLIFTTALGLKYFINGDFAAGLKL